jgi:glycosyltransferase involved in cell wall biosynthesis
VSDTTERTRILHVFGRMHRGGAELRTLDLMRAIDRRRFQLHFCTLSGTAGSLAGEIRALGGDVHPVALGLSFPLRFHRLLRAQRFDVVHSHVHYASGLVLALARLRGVPVRVAHFRNTHDGKPDDWRYGMQRRLLRGLIDAHATHILAVCEGAMRVAWGPEWARDPRCQVIYNGLDLAPFAGAPARAAVRGELGFPADCPLYIHVGRLTRQKNQLRTVAIFARIRARTPEARLLLVGHGDGALEARLRERVADASLQGSVLFVGERADVPRLLRASDVLLFPSLWEGLPGVVLEACAAGIPVLASDLPGVLEIAAHFASVRALPLDVPDETWAHEAVRLAADRRAVVDDTGPRERFAASVFDLRRCAEAMGHVWRGQAAGGGRHTLDAWKDDGRGVAVAP